VLDSDKDERMHDMELKGQKVYVVCSFNSEDALSDYKIFADPVEAEKYQAKAHKREQRYGGHAYIDTTTIS
jgi:hypothetical protein